MSFSKHSFIFLILFVSSIIPFFLKTESTDSYNKKNTELFNSDYINLNNYGLIISQIDFNSKFNHISSITDTAAYVSNISDFVKRRFYFGLAKYKLSDNWIAYLSGKYIWKDFSVIVNPEDLIKHEVGLCSQQSLVFMEILKRKHIKVRSVGIGEKKGPGHFLCEVFYSNSWHIFDISFEPNWNKIHNKHSSLNYYKQHKDSLFLIYEGKIDSSKFELMLKNITYGSPNKFPAQNMLLFHKITLILTYLIPIVFLVFFIKALFKK